LLAVGAINTALSAYYYLRVARAMLLEDPADAEPLTNRGGVAVFLLVLVAFLIAAGLVWEPLMAATTRAAETFPAT
jgi:NADH-quinone oxidoreductase subunit N